MAHLQWLLVLGAWLLVLSHAVRSRVRRRPHRHWLTAIETLRGWDTAAEREPLLR